MKWAADTEATPSNSGSQELPASGGMGICVNSTYDSGNIEVISISDPNERDVCHTLELRIHEDPFCESDRRAHFQWFSYRVSNARHEKLIMKLMNAGQASFPFAWHGYSACASYDRHYWFRVPTQYDKESGVLTITHIPERDAVQYAYFASYSYQRHQSMVADLQSRDSVRLEMMGQTLDGHDLDILIIGEPAPEKRKVWVVARQHPGETMAEFVAEGLVRRLLDRADGVSRKALREAVFYVVPNMNPDGSWRGHLRTNAAGANLNREWAAPSAERSPEVLLVRNKMDRVGVDLCLDVHGDEALPHIFLAGNEGIPGWNERLAGLQQRLSDALLRASPDFQDKYGYGKGSPGKADMRIAAHAIGQRYDCLAVTLELPFKDTADAPEPVQGWSAERSLRFGAAALGAVLEVIPHLR
ncbi:hypothetical protein WJX81_005410 [Elliptochloris bilobata]|uniref:Peptidase M14 domain-containing protein n=1 Tax=Elliptochloris bilobata TaxID=381761 RepID=A0AAW1R4E3_9CHLO